MLKAVIQECKRSTWPNLPKTEHVGRSGRGDAKVAVKALATSQGIATMVLQNLREFHDKAEAHNASIQ